MRVPFQEGRLLQFAALGVGAIAAVGAGLYWLAARDDRTMQARERAIVADGVAARINDIEQETALLLARRASGDAAFAGAPESLVAAASVRGGCHGTGFDVIRAAGDPKAFDAAARRQIALVCGARTAALSQRSSVLWLGDDLALVTAHRFGDGRMFVTARRIDQNFVADIGARYRLADIHMHPGDTSGEEMESHVVVRDEDGAIEATVDWVPGAASRTFADQTAPVVLSALTALLVVALALYRRSWRQTRALIASERRATHVALHDATTGLPNRAHLASTLRDALADGAATLIVVGLDRFKYINETFGVGVGDEVLRATAERLRRACPREGWIARIGGDEFAIAIIGASAPRLADQILGEFDEPMETSIGARVIGCSIGIANGETGSSESELLRRADLALMRAKMDGRGLVRAYDEALDDLIRDRQRLMDELRAAIAAGQLTMAYQPQVSISGEVVGVEALVRWTHPVDGPVSPAVFVPLAEEAGLSEALSAFTLEQAIRDSRRWPHIKTAVNVSPAQIQDPMFVVRLDALVQVCDADPAQIEIEITEGALLAPTPQAHAALDRLHALGFSIALDDFGTGYSSLSYLLRFPFDKVKIDRAFVSQLGRDERADALFSAIVALARGIGLRVIAEGVETQDQWLRLMRAGCAKIQGYAASPALAADDLAVFLEEWPRRRLDGGDQCRAAATV